MVTMDQSLTLSRAFEFIFMVCGQLMFDHVLCNKSYSLPSHISSPTFLLGMSQIYSSISFLRQINIQNLAMSECQVSRNVNLLHMFCK